MNDLTHEQARMLRAVRVTIKGIAAKLDSASTDIACGCTHDNDPDNCEVCRLYSLISDVEEFYDSFATELDAVLERGPVPGEDVDATARQLLGAIAARGPARARCGS